MFTFWTKPGCTYCTASLQTITSAGLQEGIDFEKRNLLDFPEMIEQFRESGVRALPVIEYDSSPVHSGMVTSKDVERLRGFGGQEDPELDDLWDDIPDVIESAGDINFNVRQTVAPVLSAASLVNGGATVEHSL